ncbi:hypothetical protein Mterra_01599 [Calidithermus terrae]|uniref:Peptidase C39-like domain-containing protein n=1 Tax=Calidithermus terrae TaxID=1408545 RepID=A0A399ETC1_9DEIN|nr:hypothetical protein [Calidithermus terrae]RIH85842.1 hypothetical protein Mterra_01599 [Calidithermus terrae]
MSTESSFDWSQPVPRLSGYDFSRKPRWQGHRGGYLSGYNARYFLEYDHPAGTARLWVFCRPIFGTRGWYGEGPASYDPASSSIRFSVQGIRHDPRSGQPLTILRCTGEAKDMPDHVGLKLNPSEKPLSERRLTNPPTTQTSTPTVVTPLPPPPKPPAPSQAKQPQPPQLSSKPSPQATATTVASPPPQASQATQPLQRVWPKPRHFVGQIAGRVPIHLELDRPFGDKVIGYSSSTWERGEGSFDLIGRITPGGVLNLVAYSGKQPVRKLVGSIQGERGDRLVADWLELDQNGRVVRSRELVAVYTPSPAPAPTPEPAPRQASQNGNGAPDALDELMGLEEHTPRYTVEQIRRARGLIAQEPDAKRRGDLYLLLQTKVSYRNQRNNESVEVKVDSQGNIARNRYGAPVTQAIGDVMCNLTSLAMALETIGIGKPSQMPDQTQVPQEIRLTEAQFQKMQFEDYLEWLRKEKVRAPRWTEAGWGGTAKQMGAEYKKIATGFVAPREWWIRNVLPYLARGYGVIMSIDQHIVRLQNVTDKGLVVDDPYGSLNLSTYDPLSVYSSYRRDGSEPNSRNSEASVGEDNIWPWVKVEKKFILWIAVFWRKERS